MCSPPPQSNQSPYRPSARHEARPLFPPIPEGGPGHCANGWADTEKIRWDLHHPYGRRAPHRNGDPENSRPQSVAGRPGAYGNAYRVASSWSWGISLGGITGVRKTITGSTVRPDPGLVVAVRHQKARLGGLICGGQLNIAPVLVLSVMARNATQPHGESRLIHGNSELL